MPFPFGKQGQNEDKKEAAAMAEFKRGDRVQRMETKEKGTVQDVTEDPRQTTAPVWYSVLWDGSSAPEDVVYPRQLKRAD
jgi:hypothetical protein